LLAYQSTIHYYYSSQINVLTNVSTQNELITSIIFDCGIYSK